MHQKLFWYPQFFWEVQYGNAGELIGRSTRGHWLKWGSIQGRLEVNS